MCTEHLGLPPAHGVSGSTKAQATALCTELKMLCESN